MPREYRLIILSDYRSPAAAADQSASSDVELASRHGSLVAKLFDNSTHIVTLDNGTSVSVRAQVEAAMKLDEWSIDAQSWVAIADNSTTTGYSTEPIHNDTTRLSKFGQHPTLVNVSGTAVYTTTFAMGPSPHAHIDLGLCSQTCNISIVGNPGPALNILNPVADISDLLFEGINKVQIEVSTPINSAGQLP